MTVTIPTEGAISAATDKAVKISFNQKELLPFLDRKGPPRKHGPKRERKKRTKSHGIRSTQGRIFLSFHEGQENLLIHTIATSFYHMQKEEKETAQSNERTNDA